MDKHKRTPDLLAEILGGEAATSGETSDSTILSAQLSIPDDRAPAKVRNKIIPTTKLGSHHTEETDPKQTRKSPTTKTNPVKTWEYRLVTFQEHKGWRARFLNGRELKDWTEGELIHSFLQRMGEEGWELVAASGGERMYSSGDRHQLYFKRLIG